MTKLRNEVIFKHKKGEQITERRTRAGSIQHLRGQAYAHTC